MRRDDFNGFYADRRERILRRIEDAMGKEIPRSEAPEEGEFSGEEE